MPLINPHGLLDNSPRVTSIGQVKKLLIELNSKKATGTDNISAWTLKRFAEELAVLVHDIICASIIERNYPTLYKHALFSPVPNFNPPKDLETDFREISVLPVLGRVLEKVQIMLDKDAFRVKENKRAFIYGRSTVSALVNITQTCLNDSDSTTEGEKAIHSLFIDFSKAFDQVDHSILLSKLKGRNINKSLWQWIQSFLQGRTQQVKLPGHGVLSRTRTCPECVPQIVV